MSDVGPSVSCVVVAFHRPEQLRRLLEGLEARWTVVANVEADPQVSMLCRVLGVREVPIPENVGFAAAVNAAAATCSTEAVVFSNDDVLYTWDDVRALASGLEVSTAVVPAIVDATGSVQYSVRPLLSLRTLLVEWLLLPDTPWRWLPGAGRVQKWRRPPVTEPVLAASAAVVAVGAGTLSRHPLPEAYFLYWEEIEWFAELAKDGGTIRYDAGVRVLHDGGREVVTPLKASLLSRNAIRCMARTRGPLDAALSVPVVTLWALRLYLLDLVRCRRDRLRARRAGLHGVLLGIDDLRRSR